MDFKLRNKKAIITGGTRGIGKKIAEVFLDEGMDVAFCGRNKTNVEKTVAELSTKDRKILGGTLDIRDHKKLEEWIIQSAQLLGGLDILVLNAGAMVESNSDEDWLNNFNVDLLGAVHATNAAKPFLTEAAKKNGDAAIIYISSISASNSRNESSYGPIKAALIHFAKGVAKQEGTQKIRANVISPGPVYFENGYWQQVEKENPELFQQIIQRSPLGRMATAEEIANSVVFLASPLSAYTTGANLVIDGCLSDKVYF